MSRCFKTMFCRPSFPVVLLLYVYFLVSSTVIAFEGQFHGSKFLSVWTH
jgi:hypothetical protein